MKIIKDQEYISWITELKQKVRSAQIKAALSVNTELILFYWDLGMMLSEKIKLSNWGDKVLENVSRELKDEFPAMKGFSVTNLKYTKLFYEYFKFSHQLGDELKKEQNKISSQPVNQINVEQNEISQQAGNQTLPLVNQPDTIGHQAGDQLYEFIKNTVATLPWRHIVEIINKSKSIDETLFYIQKTKENNWSRDVLSLQIKSSLFQRNGKAVTNFKNTLPQPLSDLAQQTLKDPYIFDFLQLSEGYKEKDIENQLVNHLKKFLLELGKGFAFVGQQYHLEIADKDYYLDLLFYHIKLKCYVVIELKNTAFIPEYAGKLNFYLSAVDSILKETEDKPAIGILLCREKNNIEAEFALRDINKPMGVSEYELTNILPENLKSSLPTIEELEQNLLN